MSRGQEPCDSCVSRSPVDFENNLFVFLQRLDRVNVGLGQGLHCHQSEVKMGLGPHSGVDKIIGALFSIIQPQATVLEITITLV